MNSRIRSILHNLLVQQIMAISASKGYFFENPYISRADWEIKPWIAINGNWGFWENWAEGVAVRAYPPNKSPEHLTVDQSNDITGLLQP